MTQKYDIDSLIQIFEKHAKKSDEEIERQAKEYFSVYGKTHPRYEVNFNLPQALYEICKEIKAINQWIDEHCADHHYEERD